MTAFVDALQARGRYTFTLTEAIKTDERSAVAREAALRRLKRKGRIASPRRGFYVIVPVEYREAGCPPAKT
jgi:predicted transcriptional regulator of viral defense system